MKQDSFFQTSDGEDVTKTDGAFDGGGGDIEPIPAKTQVLAAIDEISWDELPESNPDAGEDFINARWTVLAPPEFKNRKIFQKIRPLCEDSKKADKSKKMFAAIDANAGGKIAKLGKLPDDVALQCLTGKPQVLMLQVWQFEKDDGEKMSGNWVSSVSPRKAGGVAKEQAKPEPVEAPAGGNFDDDIPF